MPRQTPSASDFTSVVRSSAVANDVASKPAGSPAAIKATAAAVKVGGGLASVNKVASVVKQSAVAKAIAPPPVRATVVTVPVVNPLTVQTAAPEAYIVAYNTSGIAQWAAKIESGEFDMIMAIVTDSTGNVYAAGRCTGVAKVYSSNGVLFGSISNRGLGDPFLIKYNSSGIVQWMARGGTTNDNDIGMALGTDSNGNVYMVGSTGTGTAVAYSSNGSQFMTTTLPSPGGPNVFIVKYNSAGIVQWLAGVVSAQSDFGNGIAVDGSGNVYVTGSCANVGSPVTALNADGSPFANSLPTPGADDAFLVKYNTNGVVQWLAGFGSPGNDYGNGLTLDVNGDLYVVGQSNQSPTILNSNSSSFGMLASSGSNDAIIIKYTTNGTVQWATRIASSGSDIAYSIATDSAANVYIAGQMGSGAIVTAYNANGTAYTTTLLSSGNVDAFIAKYSTDGFVQWITKLASGGADAARAIAIDSNDDIYVIGDGSGPLTALSRSGPSLAITNTGLIDTFIAKYNSAGTVQWLTKIAGTDNDYGRAVAFDKINGILLVGGYYYSTPLTITNA